MFRVVAFVLAFCLIGFSLVLYAPDMYAAWQRRQLKRAIWRACKASNSTIADARQRAYEAINERRRREDNYW